jgi:hypothetical protein
MAVASTRALAFTAPGRSWNLDALFTFARYAFDVSSWQSGRAAFGLGEWNRFRGLCRSGIVSDTTVTRADLQETKNCGNA